MDENIIQEGQHLVPNRLIDFYKGSVCFAYEVLLLGYYCPAPGCMG